MSTTARITVLTVSAVSGSVLGLGLYHGLASGPANGEPGSPGATSPPSLTVPAPCPSPARLEDGVCVTEVQRTRVVTERAEAPASSTPAAGSTAGSSAGGYDAAEHGYEDEGADDAYGDDHGGDDADDHGGVEHEAEDD